MNSLTKRLWNRLTHNSETVAPADLGKRGFKTMLNSKEDAEQYIKEITEGCENLCQLSIKAGLYSHAAIFQTILAAINDSAEEMETISHMMGMYLENRLHREF